METRSEDTGAPGLGDFSPCMAEDCPEEAPYDCYGCGAAFCGYHMTTKGPDLCDSCYGIKRGLRW
mgnify:CR=1 FL=1